MTGITGTVLVAGYLLFVLSGWGMLGYVYYGVLHNMPTIQARYRALATLFLAFLIGMPLNKAAAISTEETSGAFLLRSLAYAWWIVPYCLSAAILVVAKRRKAKGAPANKAL